MIPISELEKHILVLFACFACLSALPYPKCIYTSLELDNSTKDGVYKNVYYGVFSIDLTPPNDVGPTDIDHKGIGRCAYKYVANTDERRIPQDINEAELLDRNEKGCAPINIEYQVLKKRSGCDHDYVLGKMKITVGFRHVQERKRNVHITKKKLNSGRPRHWANLVDQ